MHHYFFMSRTVTTGPVTFMGFSIFIIYNCTYLLQVSTSKKKKKLNSILSFYMRIVVLLILIQDRDNCFFEFIIAVF
jgi:hypothetical protein